MAHVTELKHTGRERFWQEFTEVMGRPDGLMTYHYLGTHAEASDRHHATGRMRLRSDLRGPAGLAAAPLLILVADTIGILDDAIAVPLWRQRLTAGIVAVAACAAQRDG